MLSRSGSPDLRSHIFISHGKADSWLASRMGEQLAACGASIFLDEANIQKGDDFKRIIHSEIDVCDELVVLFTPWSLQRPWVWLEIGAAWGKGKRVVAVLYGLTMQEMQRKLGNAAILDDKNVVDLNNFDDYLRELKKRVKEDQRG